MNLFNQLTRTLRSYNKNIFFKDLTSAITVDVVSIPQSIAFAMLANINPIYGLYTAIIGSIVISLFSSSSHIAGGATNATCLLIASSLAAYSDLSYSEYMFIVFQFTFIVGIFQILFGVLKLGKILNYISHAVIEGFTIGAALLIIFGQANKIVGLSLPNGLLAFQKVFFIIENYTSWNIYSIIITLIAILIIYFSKKIHNLVPGQLIAIITTGFIVYIFKLELVGVSVVGDTPISLPSLKFFPLSINNFIELAPMALSYSLIALISAIAITKTIAKQSNEKIDSNREFIAQGITNVTSSFFQSFAGTASVSRTALNYFAGARTRMSGIFTGIFIALFLAFLGKLVAFIPNSTLAAIIIFSAFKMIDFREITAYFKAKTKDFIVAVLTLLAVLLFPKLDSAVLFGVAISIIIYLYESGSANIKILRFIPYKNKLYEINIDDIKEEENSITILLEGNLYFGLAYDLEEKFSILRTKCNNFILRFRSVNSIDMTTYDIILDFTNKVIDSGGKLKLCGVNNKLYKFLEKNGYFKVLSKDNLFKKEDELYSSFSKALEKIETECLDEKCTFEKININKIDDER